MSKVIITGHTSGLGAAIWEAMECQHTLVGWAKPFVDINNCKELEDAADDLGAGSVDVLINCAGVNYINWHEDTPDEEWDRIMNTNAKALWRVSKVLINGARFNRPATILNVVSNASHMPMTNSAAYNASKGAAHILTLQMARELKKRHDITVFGISPNRLKGTAMSEYISKRVCDLRGWTREEADSYQISSLPAGEETDPATLAEFIAFLLSGRRRHKFLHGTVIPYGA